MLRQVRRRPPDGADVVLSASDPANLLGSVLRGPKVARIAGARVLYRDGLALGTVVAGEVTLLEALTPAEEQRARRALSLDPGVRFLEGLQAGLGDVVAG